MIKNIGLALLLALIGVGIAAVAACREHPHEPERFQGVVELQERDLSFELPGRVVRVLPKRGATVKPEQLLATLDDSLDRTAREARERDVETARARVALLRAGARGEQDVQWLAGDAADTPRIGPTALRG